MATPTEAQLVHQALLEEIDIHSVHKTFRSANWRPNHRRNKNIKTIMTDAARKEAAALSSAAPTPQNNSGAATPTGATDGKDDGLSTSGTSTPASGAANGENGENPNLAQASRSLSKLVLEKNMMKQAAESGGSGGGSAAGGVAAPAVTYTNIESAPSLAHTKHYCDVTGLPAPYLDPKTRLRYHDKEVFGLIRSLPQGAAEQYLEARGAHVVLK